MGPTVPDNRFPQHQTTGLSSGALRLPRDPANIITQGVIARFSLLAWHGFLSQVAARPDLKDLPLFKGYETTLKTALEGFSAGVRNRRMHRALQFEESSCQPDVQLQVKEASNWVTQLVLRLPSAHRTAVKERVAYHHDLLMRRLVHDLEEGQPQWGNLKISATITSHLNEVIGGLRADLRRIISGR